ncbi:Peptidyl-prolyl cis-trans isomerase-like 4, partial [Dispira simplex]
LDYLDGKYAVFGYVAEGLDVLERIDRAHCDETGRPFQDIRIHHTIILDDPFPDPAGLTVPGRSPLPTQAQLATVRIADYEEIEDPDEQDEIARERAQREREAQTQALTLEMIGDLPHAEIRPPENVLFVCKLNPVTSDEDLEMIFSRFGTIISCQIIRDRKIGTSLGYAFIEFARKEECERAYFKMNNVLIDDRRIKVDFSQSVAKLHHQWVESQVQQRGRHRPGALHADSDWERSPSQRHCHRQRSPRRADRRRSRRSSYDRRRRSRSASRSPQPHSGRYRSPSRQSPRQRDRHYRTSHRQRR